MDIITLCLLTSRRHNSCFVLLLHTFVQHLVKLLKPFSKTSIYKVPTQMMDSPQVLFVTVNVKKILQSINSKKRTDLHTAVIRGLAETWYEAYPVK